MTQLKVIDVPAKAARRAASSYVEDEQGCYISTYSVNSSGYAQIGWVISLDPKRSRMTTAHRAAWVDTNGPIPAGMTVDHLCKSRRCVRVDHLRLLSNFENARRTNGRDWPLGTCINGHSNSELRTEPSGRRRCRRCKRDGAKRRRLRRQLT
ncbi:HNH endonuclease signature motif containing protein [Micromonospora sp. NPDC047762]|uniref:HNH endonuclease signature motif containing protein n=1 Tax=Micromonospora sp. NPDC047762 TaxID=3364255 RepID=UPI00371DB4E6